LLAVTAGLFDDLAVDKVKAASLAVGRAAAERLTAVVRRIEAGDPLSDADKEALLALAKETIKQLDFE
jgi:F-type H+-transporting ATPase subunit alpha